MKRSVSPLRAITAVILFTVSTTMGGLVAQSAADLDQAIGSPAFSSVVEKALLDASSLEEIDILVSDYIPRVSTYDERVALLLEAAAQYELAQRYDKAKHAYLQARHLQPRNGEIALRLGTVLIEEGSLQESIIIFTNALHAAETRSLQRRAAILRARAYYLSGNADQALIHLRSLAGLQGEMHPALADLVEVDVYALLAEIASDRDMDELYRQAATHLRELFPDAPETMLLSALEETDTSDERPSRVVYYPSPSRIASGGMTRTGTPVRESSLPSSTMSSTESGAATSAGDMTRRDGTGNASPPSGDATPARTTERGNTQRPSGIQTGSFRDPENARYMARDIEGYGFDVTVKEVTISGNTYYRVVVPLAADSTNQQETIIALKERGVEGFLVFE